MEFIKTLFFDGGLVIRPHGPEVAAAIVATLLVIFGDQINGIVRTLVKPYSFTVRVGAFVALCAFGYGALAFYVTPWVHKIIEAVPTVWLLPLLLLVFILLGVLAERSHKS